MRLLSCQLQKVRLHDDLSLSFAPTLTLIGGPNESGKSTLVEALHRALFLKAAATGAPVEALQSRLHLGQPVVQLSFEAAGDTWTLRKRFSGSTGQVTLQAENSGKPLTGPLAEEALAALVGVREIVGSKQANTVLPSRWAHLWVRQGASGDDLLADGKDSYDFDRLRLQLENSGGAAVQQSALDQRVEQRISAALEENFTSRGTKKHSPLYQREEELQAAQARMNEALDRLTDYENASEELAGIGEQLEQLQTVNLPALQESQRLLAEGAEQAGRLDGAIELAAKALEPIRLRHDAASEALRQLDDLGTETGQRNSKLAQLQASAERAQAREAELLAARALLQESWERLSRQRQSLEQRQELLRLLVERGSLAEELQRLASELDKVRRSDGQRQELARHLKELPPITRAELQRLRRLEQQRRDASTRLQAMAAGVKLLQADQLVKLNGEPLEVGAQQRLSRVFQLQVGDGVILEIAPGGGEALGDLEASAAQLTRELAAGLAAFKAADLEAAEALLEQRTALEQQQASLGEPTTTADLARIEQHRDGLRQRLAELEADLEPLAASRQELEQEQQQPLPSAMAELQTLQQQIARNARHTATAAQAAEKELEVVRAAVQSFQEQRLSEASQLEVVRAELADRQQRSDALVAQHGDRQSQTAGLADLSDQRQRAEAHLAQLQADRAALGSQDAARQQQQIQAQLENLNRSIEQLLDQRGAAKQRCDSISSNDPFAAVEQARRLLETAEADHRNLLRLTEAQRLLQELFQEAQADLSSRYTEPLAQAIGSYLRPLVPNGPVARLSYDQTRGFLGLQLRRGQEFYNFDALSGGMREQLAAALRLSMADVLKDAHDGCLPLVFDDAFTNSDPERIDLVKRMLGTAVERGLQVILLTCDPAAYGTFAEQVVNLG
jgi:uncharacterized protein YhaN